MNIETRQRFNQIFEIKVNEANLTKIMNHFYAKVTQFQQNIATIDTKIKDQMYSPYFESRIHYLVNRQTESRLITLGHQLNDREKDIHRLESSFANYHANQSKQHQGLVQQLKECSFRVFQMGNANQMKHKETKLLMDVFTGELEQDRTHLESFSQEILQKLQQLQDQKSNQYTLKEEIQQLQRQFTIYMNQTDLLLKQISNDTHGVAIKGMSTNPLTISDKGEDGQPILKKNNFRKSRVNIRKSINTSVSSNRNTQDQSSLFNSFQLLSQYKTLKDKIQTIENSVFIMSQNMKKNPRALQRNDSAKSIQSLEVPKRNIKPSKFSRASIHTNTNHFPQTDRDERECLDPMALQIRSINEKLKKIELKSDISDQNYNNLLQKLHRLGHLQSKVQCKIEEVEKLRVDLSTINEINSRFKNMASLMQVQETKYVLQKNYRKDIEEMKANSHNQLVSINQMAKRQQIKQAIVFLENRIKQIVIILTNRFQGEKQGAINKVQNIKCLSCDKDGVNQHIRNTKTSHANRLHNDKAHKEPFKRIKTNERQQS